MICADLLADGFDRVRSSVHEALDGLTPGQLSHRLDARANSIGWLVWHLTRVQDDHVSEVAGLEEVWTAQGWVDRFDLPFHSGDTGFGHRSSDVAAVRLGSAELAGYYDAVHEQTLGYLRELTDDDLDRVVDEGWTPPVTLGARLVSVIADDLQHAGQAAFARGVILRG